MDYRKFGDTVYVRMDKDDEIIGSILDICKKSRSHLPFSAESVGAAKRKYRHFCRKPVHLKHKQSAVCWKWPHLQGV